MAKEKERDCLPSEMKESQPLGEEWGGGGGGEERESECYRHQWTKNII